MVLDFCHGRSTLRESTDMEDLILLFVLSSVDKLLQWNQQIIICSKSTKEALKKTYEKVNDNEDIRTT